MSESPLVAQIRAVVREELQLALARTALSKQPILIRLAPEAAAKAARQAHAVLTSRPRRDQGPLGDGEKNCLWCAGGKLPHRKHCSRKCTESYADFRRWERARAEVLS